MKHLYLTTAAILVSAPSAFDMDTVKVIATENGPLRISASDFDPKVHTLHEANETHDEDGVLREVPIEMPTKKGRRAAAVQPVVAPVVPPIEPPADAGTAGTDTPPVANVPPADSVSAASVFKDAGVLQNGKKFMIVDGAMKPIVFAGIDPNGYDDNASAWGVLIPLKTAANNVTPAA